MSIHTWPERGYAALDVFMCGDADPLLALPVLKEHFKPDNVEVLHISRSPDALKIKI
jgi:S-adenosylmethionine decarboxylase